LNQAEIYRARATLFNNLLNQTSGEDVNSEIADQVIYLGRRVGRSEAAKRFSAVADVEYLQNICTKWFYDVELCGVAWGPLHGVMQYAQYNRAWKRSTLGWHGYSQAETQ
jgi:mitochondrial-processing peptidase subunit beta